MINISAVIITFNEEDNIGRCLDSVRNVADEIIVVDSFSNDRTEDICRSYGVRFVQNRFGGYIEQKNFAVSHSSNPVVLSLDADEALSPELESSILEVKKAWKHDGYYVNRINNYCGKWIRHTSWYPDRKLRLWDKRKGSWGGLNPHDRVELVKNSTTSLLKGNIKHYSYSSVSGHISRINLFTDIAARSYYEAGIGSGYLNIIINPLWRLFRELVLKRGLLGGYYGIVLSGIMSFETFLKYIKIKRFYNINAPRPGALVFFNSSQTWGGGEKWHFQAALKFRDLGYPVYAIVNRKSDLANRLRKHSVPLRQLRFSNLSLFNPCKYFLVFRYFRKINARTVILNLSSDAKIGGIAAYLAGLPVIIYRRGLAAPISDSISNRFIFRKIFTRVIANSEDTKRMILLNNPKLMPHDRILVIPNWIDPYERMDVSEIYYQKSGNELVLGNLGRMVEVKGQDILIELAALLKADNVDFRMLIGGTGRLESYLKEYAVRLNVEKEVVFTGFVNDVRSFMRTTDIFVLGSRYEGFGFVLAEAMAEGKPVIAFDISSLPETIKDGENGFLLPYKDVKGMADRIKLLASDRELLDKMGEKGREMVFERFTFEKQSTELINAFGLEQAGVVKDSGRPAGSV